ncbi:MAG: hypothetical protein EOP53_23140 [Sphingobacteriales bacterium]|nr:MAG: hypothetical protein EOP53_23140 [Sphingobacteriales bacterium]
MKQLSNIHVSDSIVNQKLILKEKWFDKFDQISLYVIFGMVTYLFSYIFYKEFPSNSFIINFLCPLMIFLSAYIIYRKATEKNLRFITGKKTVGENHKILLEFAAKNDYEIHRKSTSCLIFNQPNGFTNTYQTSTILLLEDDKIYYTMLQDNFRLDVPI